MTRFGLDYSPTYTNKCGWLNTVHCRDKGSQKLLAKVREQETKTFTMLGEVGMASESTKTTQTSVWMAQHNEQTRLA